MKKCYRYFLTFVVLPSCKPSQVAQVLSSEPKPITMTCDLEEQLGQMIIMGFRGFELNKSNPILEAIRDQKIGGVVLFNKDVGNLKFAPELGLEVLRNIRSPRQVKKLTSDLQDYASKSSTPSLFIAVDQEGGRVARLKLAPDDRIPQAEMGAQFETFLSPEEMTQKGKQAVYDESLRMGKMLSGLGFNLNFAPLADTNVNPSNPVIGKLKRSYSSNPVVVAEMAEAFIDGQAAEGIATSLKHFPGHGSSTADSHAGFVDVSKTWQPRELDPFRTLIEKGKVDTIMTAHIVNSKIFQGRTDDTGLPSDFRRPDGSLMPYPATMSRFVITNVLRKELGFKGVIISDDLQMGALKSIWTYEQVLERVLLSGIDILLPCLNSKYAYADKGFAYHTVQVLKDLVLNRPDLKRYNLRQQVEDSYKRIMRLKAARHIIPGFTEVQCSK